MSVRPLFSRLALWVAAGGASLMLSTSAHATTTGAGKKQVCAYTQNQTTMLTAFAALAGRSTVDCGMVYVNSPDWAGWDSPWFLHYSDPNDNWATWVHNSPANDPRQLIVNTTLIPSNISSGDWRGQGAAGNFESYDTTLAQNLVGAGLSDAIIVLGAEANGNWEYDWIGSTPTQIADWVQTWRNTVIAMRSVPGAHFQFVWTINNRVPATPFTSYYPGDDVVDIIGDDAYDMGVTGDANDWNEVSAGVDGVNALVAFAQAHDKPVAFPEWGVGVRNTSNLAGGDDPAYVNGLAGVIADNDVAFQSYFFNHEWQTQLQQGPLSLAAYTAAFGDGGWAVGSDDGENVTPAPSYAQSPPPGSSANSGSTTTAVTGGPASGGTTATTGAQTATAPASTAPASTAPASAAATGGAGTRAGPAVKPPAKAGLNSGKRHDTRSRAGRGTRHRRREKRCGSSTICQRGRRARS